MGIETALISGGMNLAGGMMDRNAAKGQASDMNKFRQANMKQSMDMMYPAYQNAQNGMVEGYGRAGDIQQENLNRNTGLMAQSFMPQAQTYQAGNMAAQQSIADSLPQMRSALLGGRIPETMRAQALPIDQNALQGILNPQAQQFPTTQKFQNIRGPG